MKSVLCFQSTVQQLKEDYLNCCLARGYWYMAVQLKDVIASTALKEYDVMHQITDLCEYVKYDYWASEASPTLGCLIEISRDVGMSLMSN